MARRYMSARRKFDEIPAEDTPGDVFTGPDITPSTNNVKNPSLMTAPASWGISVGDSVHFVDETGVHRASTVTVLRVAETCEVDLSVSHFLGTRTYERVVYDASGKKRGTWHWPEGSPLNPR